MLTRANKGNLVLSYDIHQSTDLETWTLYQARSMSLTNLPTDKAFVRIAMIGSNQPIAPPEPPALITPPYSDATPIGSNL
jgi:hypothetical protein